MYARKIKAIDIHPTLFRIIFAKSLLKQYELNQGISM